MTSIDNNDETINFFKEHDYFGYNPEYVKYDLRSAWKIEATGNKSASGKPLYTAKNLATGGYFDMTTGGKIYLSEKPTEICFQDNLQQMLFFGDYYYQPMNLSRAKSWLVMMRPATCVSLVTTLTSAQHRRITLVTTMLSLTLYLPLQLLLTLYGMRLSLLSRLLLTASWLSLLPSNALLSCTTCWVMLHLLSLTLLL